TQIGPHLLAQARGGEAVGAPVHAGPGAADVPADGGQPAAGVFDETAYSHVRPHVGGLDDIHKLTVAVVHHADHVGLYGFAEPDQLPDLLHGEGGAGGVALAALDGDELGSLVDGRADGRVVEGAVGQQVRLPVGDAVLRQGAGGGADADDLLEGVIGRPHRGEDLIPRQQIGAESHR